VRSLTEEDRHLDAEDRICFLFKKKELKGKGILLRMEEKERNRTLSCSKAN